MLFAYVDGQFIRKEVHLVETCNGRIISGAENMDSELQQYINDKLRIYTEQPTTENSTLTFNIT